MPVARNYPGGSAVNDYPEQARSADDHRYHRVVFGPGPKVGERTATCGKVARFYPRIGVQMDDEYCRVCLEAAAAEEEAR
jgi:hypothetical protein